MFEPFATGTRIGSRLIYWGRSLRFLEQAPVIGHGTGSIHALFEQAAVGVAADMTLARGVSLQSSAPAGSASASRSQP